MTDVNSAAVAPPQEKPSNPFSRIVGVLFSPGQTFADIARKPDWVVPALVIIVVFFAAAIVTVPRLDFEGLMRQSMEAKGVTGAQAEQGMRFGLAMARGIQYTLPFLMIGFLAVAALLYWLPPRAPGGGGGAQPGVFVVVIRQLVKIPIVLSKHNINPRDAETIVRSGPAFLVNFKDHPMLFALLSRLDLFAIWTLILIVIGLAVAARISKAKSAGVVIVVWTIATLMTVGFAAIGAARGQ